MGYQGFRIHRWTSIIALALFLFGCQKIEQPRTELTQSQWRNIQEHLLDEPPEPEHPIGVQFGDEIELIGLDVEGELRAGQEVTFTWYWRAMSDVNQDWRIFVHFDSQEARHRQNLDHYPLGSQMNDVFRTYHWKEGHIIEDVQTFTVMEDYPGGDAVPYIGLYRGDTRSPVSNSGPSTDDNRAIGPTLTIIGGETGQLEAPGHTIPRLSTEHAATFTVDGQLDETFWRDIPSFRLSPISGGAAYSTSIKAAYTEDALIIGARLEDEHIWSTKENRDEDLWNEEVLEIFLAPGGAGSPYVELQVNPLGTIFDARFERPLSGAERSAQIDEARAWNLDGLEVAVHVEGELNDSSHRDEFWTVEMRIPFDGLQLEGAPPAQDDQWKVNIYRFDRPDDNTTHAYGWATNVGGNFHRVDRFGSWSFGSALTRAPSLSDLNQRDRDRLRNSIRKDIDQNLQPRQ